MVICLVATEMIFWEWDDYGKWLRFPLSVNMTLICAEHRSCNTVRVSMGDAQLRIDLTQQRLFHHPSNSCRPLRRTLVTSDLFCTLASRMHQVLLDRAAAADSLAMLRANLKQRLIDDRSLAPSTGLLENALTAVQRSDPHAILMASTLGSRPQLAIGRQSLAGPTLTAASASRVMNATDENLIAAKLLRDDMNQTVTNVTKLKVICQERISVITSLAHPLKWPPPPQSSSTPPTPTSSLSRKSSMSTSTTLSPQAGSSGGVEPIVGSAPSGSTSLPSIPELSSRSRSNSDALMPEQSAFSSVSGSISISTDMGTPTSASAAAASIVQGPSSFGNESKSALVFVPASSGMSPVVLHRGGSSTTLSTLVEEKESKVHDPISMMAIAAQRAEADFANATIEDSAAVSSSDLDTVYDLISRMNAGPMSSEKHAEMDRMWSRLVELRSQQQAAVASLEGQWLPGGSLSMNNAVGSISSMFKATQQFDALILTFTNTMIQAESQLWAVFGPLRAAIRFVNDLIHSRLKQAKEELERDIDKMETICNLYHDQMKILDMYLNLPRDIPNWLEEAAMAHRQFMDAQRAGVLIEAAITTARTANDTAQVNTLTTRLKGSNQTQITRSRAQSRWIRKLSEAARTGWCPDLWRDERLSWANFKDSDALAAEGLLASLRYVCH
jgi:hypothetical protein